MRRFAEGRKVFFFEEWIPCDHPLPYLEYHPFPADRVIALRPRLPHWWSEAEREAGLRDLLAMLIDTSVQGEPVFWFYTPMMFGFARDLPAAAVVYDCMDELSAFRFADPRLLERESELLRRADAVFTGGWSLYEAKRHRHANIHPFPSAVDADHFRRARGSDLAAPADQAGLKGPILGFYGVIDERLDLPLIADLARLRPDWSLVMLGPVVKIDPNELPRAPNIHWLGGRSYGELPAYLSGWDVALMPFAINEATRFISPTKTPEYLAGGKPVVSTPIADVQRHYGSLKGCAIAPDAAGFVAACEAALRLGRDGDWLDEADRTIADISWDRTQAKMAAILGECVAAHRSARAKPANDAAPSRRPVASHEDFDVLVVGAGFAGAVLAERLAEGSNKRVLVIDKRDHLAGNAFDHRDAAGILVHRYGPHIFHTNAESVVDYLSRFTRWRPYEHRVLADVGGRLVPMPINRTTLNLLYGLDLRSDAETTSFLAARAENLPDIRTAEDMVVSTVGRELYETFFRGYTRKQWGLDPSELDRSVTARVPTRCDADDRYFQDRFQAMPADGYTAMFERMLDHPNITLRLGVDYRDVRDVLDVAHTVFTGPVDEFFDHRFGKLPYRSLQFRHETHDRERFQPVGVVNYPSEDVKQTRITEYKHLTGQVHAKTSISYEFPCAEGLPYYPVPREENQALYRRYEALARERPDVSFVGRLATYRYYNMDQVVGQALATYRRLTERAVTGSAATASHLVPAGPAT
ncbi:UDP-galactopyranose mutase [Aureimonas psammosilenae]|uniref:UDP-galactopyranose mutase n=1 Tax=Aureimonas psammosilenae TaxID=2495496 RepID=UPI001260C6C8|nr:UDP-galactopyranose mutase [Aureimonas psammosilenae]